MERVHKQLWVHAIKIARQIAAEVIPVVHVEVDRHREQRVIHGKDRMASRTQEAGVAALRRCKRRIGVRDGSAAYTMNRRRTIGGILQKRKQTVPHLG